MSLATRVGLSLGALLLLTVLGAWLVAGVLFLRPLAASLVLERADTAVYVADRIESAEDPMEALSDLSEQLNVELTPWPPSGAAGSSPPWSTGEGGERWERPGAGHGRRWGFQGRGGGARRRFYRFQRSGRRVLVSRGSQTRIFVEVHHLPQGYRGVVVEFPVDLKRPVRRAGIGFLALGLLALLGALLLTGWMLKPLRVASTAMERVASGDLQHRAPEGNDVAGRMGTTFNRMASRVEALVEGQRRLMAAVSHELRTPLARMRLELELLKERGAPPERIASLESDIREVDTLVEEILESSRLEQGGPALHLGAVSIRELVEEALGTVELGDREVQLHLDPDPTLEADPARMRRVFVNLLSNVARYTPPEARVEVHARTGDAGRVRIWVEDDGPGVSEEDLPQLFEPFYRTEQSRSRRTGGLGLGLMLVRQVVQAHGGQVWAENRSSGGLRVVMELPTAQGFS